MAGRKPISSWSRAPMIRWLDRGLPRRASVRCGSSPRASKPEGWHLPPVAVNDIKEVSMPVQIRATIDQFFGGWGGDRTRRPNRAEVEEAVRSGRGMIGADLSGLD